MDLTDIEAEYTEEEIKTTVRKLGGDIAHGLDGFPIIFFITF